METSGHKTRAIFDRYNITDECDIGRAADMLPSTSSSEGRTAQPDYGA